MQIIFLFSGQHITTFDLGHYQFLGPCSYLLTRDFVGGDFSVVGVYQSEAGMVGLESLVVQGHSTNVTLHVDGTVDVTEADAEVNAQLFLNLLDCLNLL